MEVESSYGIWVVQRQKNNGLNITHDDTSIGIISPFFSFKPVFLELSEKYEITFWASIYMLVEYMMHEDDFIVV